MSRQRVAMVALPLAATVAAARTYRRHRRRQLALMPKGINDMNGVTMRSSIKAAQPTGGHVRSGSRRGV